jgi:hypothetical protein
MSPSNISASQIAVYSDPKIERARTMLAALVGRMFIFNLSIGTGIFPFSSLHLPDVVEMMEA